MKKKITIIVLLLSHLALWGQNNRITAYEYWYNTNYQTKVAVSVSPAEVFSLNTTFATPGLKAGLHTLNIRFKDQNNRWSSTQSQFFLKAGGITAYEYWFNNNYQNKVSGTLSGQLVETLNLNAPTTGLKDGINIIHVRLKEQNGMWSSTQSRQFLKTSGIAAYEYWFNNNYAAKVTGTVPVQEISIINLEAPTAGLKAGMHTFHIRTRSQNGSWSSTQSQFFWKTGAVLTRFEYWLDNKYASRVTGSMAGQPTENWFKTINLASNVWFDVIYARFQDASGAWSSTLALPTPAPMADFFMVQDRYFVTFNSTANLAKTYRWTFGDGGISTLANPSRTYTQPGEYFVKLRVNNISGADSIIKQLTIRGIQSVVPNKAGNGGMATLAIIGGGLTANAAVKLQRTGFADITPITSTLSAVGRLESKFNLSGKAVGKWSVSVTVPGFAPMVATDVFTIEQGTAPKVWANVSGNNAVLFNRWQTYTLNYGNEGNNDVNMAPIWLVVSDIPGLELEFLSKKPVVPNANNAIWQRILDSVPPYITFDSLNGKPFKARAYPFFFQPLASYENSNFTFRIKSPLSFQISTWVDENYFDDSKVGAFEACIAWGVFKAFTGGLISLLSTQLPGAGCVAGIASQIAFYDYNTVGAGQNLKNVVWALARATIDCIWSLGEQIPFVKAWSLTKEILSLAANVYESYGDNEDCKKKFKPDKAVDKPVRAVASFDPNEIIGPTGFADDRYHFDNVIYPYVITYENLKTATAPAQEVFVYDTLDRTKYNLSSFTFGNIGFGNRTIFVEPGLKQFTKDIDLRPGKNLILRVNAVFDTVSAAARWEFISLDPATMNLTEDPFGGFLPPNVTSPDGEGFVSFNILPKANLLHLTAIRNKATIVFDLNAPIITNVWQNLIDKVPPQSNVNPLAGTIAGTSFLVTWAGSDAHSGIASYTVYYSKNGSPPVEWKASTWRKAEIFEGQVGNTYAFYSVATDRIGNVELPPAGYDATTTLVVGIDDPEKPPVGQFALYPNPAIGVVNLSFNLATNTNIKLVVYDLLAREVATIKLDNMQAGSNTYPLDISKIASGTYFCSIETPQGNAVQRLVISKQ